MHIISIPDDIKEYHIRAHTICTKLIVQNTNLQLRLYIILTVQLIVYDVIFFQPLQLYSM